MSESPATSFKKIMPRTRRVRLPERRGGGVSETGVVAGSGADTDGGNSGLPLGYAAALGPTATGKLNRTYAVEITKLPLQAGNHVSKLLKQLLCFW